MARKRAAGASATEEPWKGEGEEYVDEIALNIISNQSCFLCKNTIHHDRLGLYMAFLI